MENKAEARKEHFERFMEWFKRNTNQDQEDFKVIPPQPEGIYRWFEENPFPDDKS